MFNFLKAKQKMSKKEFKIEKQDDGKYGIENMKKVMGFILDLTINVQEVTEDGKVSFGEYFTFIDDVAKIPAVFKACGHIGAEFEDLDTDERTQLANWIVENYPVPAGKVDEVMKKVWASLINLQGIWIDCDMPE